MNRIVFVIFLLILSSCNGDRAPKNLLAEDKMEAVLWDMARAQALASIEAKNDSTINADEQTKVLSNIVFQTHQISEKTFNESYNWYIKHPEVFQKLLDSLQSRKQKQNLEVYHKEPEPIKLDDPKKIRKKKIENE